MSQIKYIIVFLTKVYVANVKENASHMASSPKLLKVGADNVLHPHLV